MRTVLSEPKPWGEQNPASLRCAVTLWQNAHVWAHPQDTSGITTHNQHMQHISLTTDINKDKYNKQLNYLESPQKAQE
jgi:hypothetical protein